MDADGFLGRLRSWAKAGPNALGSFEQPRIGLALGGGFARGMAHLGVLKVFEDHAIPIHALAGTSAGSVVAAAWAGGRSCAEMAHYAPALKFSDFGYWTISRLAFASNERMERFLHHCFPQKDFESLRIPLAVVATDLQSGDAVVFREGNLMSAVRASCAYPGLFEPMQIAGRTLIDGAFSLPVPVQALADMGCTHIIAVHVGGDSQDRPGNILQVVNHCFIILQRHLACEWRRNATLVLEPELKGIRWDAFERSKEIIDAGEAAAMNALPAIKSWLCPPVPAKRRSTQATAAQTTRIGGLGPASTLPIKIGCAPVSLRMTIKGRESAASTAMSNPPEVCGS
jgi:NTE family protein